MTFSQQYLISIVEKASTIDERLGAEFIFDRTIPANDKIVATRLERWCQIVAEGDWTSFEKYLSKNNLNLETARLVLNSVSLRDQTNLPDWTEIISEADSAMALISRVSLDKGILGLENRCLDSLKPLPFEEIWLSFIYVARERLVDRAGSSYHLLSDSAHATLEHSLLSSLASLGAQALATKLRIFQHQRQPAFIRTLSKITASRSNEQYKLFVEEMLDGELRSFWQDYPVLARLAATVTEYWIDATSKFLQRLAFDREKIQSTFAEKIKLGKVIGVQTSLSDRHRQGRYAIAIQFASGLKLVYKPKDLGIEKAYNQFLTWLNNHGAPLPFKTLNIIDRSNYGWVEYVEQLPCKNNTEAKHYYLRCGMFLCLAYILKGTDFIDDNIIACGEDPVPIDLEMLLNHRIVEKNPDKNAYSLAYEQLHSSVLDTAFLPRWLFIAPGQSIDTSGLGGGRKQQALFKVRTWQNVNTDNMTLSYQQQQRETRKNVPFLNGVGISLKDYCSEVVEGFQQMYKFLGDKQKILLDRDNPDNPLLTLAHQQVRYVFRDTQIYSLLLEASLKLELLKNGVDRSIQLDFLYRPKFWSNQIKTLHSNSLQAYEQIIEAEKQALAELDVPLFTAFANENAAIITKDRQIENCFSEPSIELAIDRLENLGEDDLQQQLGFIQGSLYAHIATQTESSSNSTRSSRSPLNPSLLRGENEEDEDVPTLTQTELIDSAIAIANNLEKLAITSSNGNITWIALTYILEVQRLQLQPLSHNLYDGSSGIALFLAALAKITEKERYRSLALGAIQSLRQYLQDPNSGQAIVKHIGIGGAIGCGSIIYALTRIGVFLNESQLIEDADRVAELITPEIITVDRKFDVIAGAAGAILGLLTLYQQTQDSKLLQKATIAGQHLINSRTPSKNGLRTWQTLNNQLLTGFSHGAAGIAYALLRLSQFSSDTSFQEAALEAIAYERSVFDQKVGNWLDLRNSQPTFNNSWCHGAPGIGIARLGSLSILDNLDIRQDLEIALRTTQNLNWQTIDHLCCGNFGNLDLLLEAGSILQRPELIDQAQKQAAQTIARAKTKGYFQFSDSLSGDIHSPGFFSGTSGIGYQILRLAHPDLPSVLLWK